MSAGFADSLEHALKASSNPRIANPPIIATFCCLDQEESISADLVPWFGWVLDFSPNLDFGSLSFDFQVVVMLSPPLRLAQSELGWQECGQFHFVDATRVVVQGGFDSCISIYTPSYGRHIQAGLAAKIFL